MNYRFEIFNGFKKSNIVKLGVPKDILGKDNMVWRNASKRLYSISTQLKEGQMIVVELDCSSPEIQVTSYTNPGGEITTDDFSWVFGEFIKLETAKTPEVDSEVNDGVTLDKEKKYYAVMPDTGEESFDVVPDDFILQLVKAGIVVKFVFASGDKCNGLIFFEKNDKMSMKLKTLISMNVRNVKLVEVNSSENIDSFFLDRHEMVCYTNLILDKLSIHLNAERLNESTEKSSIPIEDMDFSIRTYNVLKRNGINTLNDILAMSDNQLMKLRNLGKRSFTEIKECIGKVALSVSDDGDGDEPDLAELTDDDLLDCEIELSDIELSDIEETEDKNNYLDKLDELIGLTEVKAQARKIAAFARMKKDLKNRGIDNCSLVLNMQFTGNPGTAKTTVARILAKYFHQIGILKGSEVLEVGRADLVAGYVGQTAKKVMDVFDRAKGRLLFIDEAYSLIDDRDGSFGDEAISTIVQAMENNRDTTIVVFAGYPDQMEMLFKRNPGLKSRVPFHLSFKDYSPEEMLEITRFEVTKRCFELDAAAEGKIIDICMEAKKSVDAGNGRFCRNLVDYAILNFATRTYSEDETFDEQEAVKLVLVSEDFELPEEYKAPSKTTHIGFSVA